MTENARIPLNERLKTVRLLLLDVDGVMTDGRLLYHADGSESKMFNVRDGLGLRLLMEAGIQVGIVTGRVSPPLGRRCQDLGIEIVFEGILDKAVVIPEIERQSGIGPEKAAYVGDDIIDLPLLKAVAVSAAPADADPLVKQQVDIITRARGGRGVVREVIEKILTAQSLWEKALERFAG